MEKSALRKKNKQRRNALSPQQREQYSLDIANQALTLDIWQYDYYHIFLPIEKQHEINTQYLLSILQGKDKHVVLSTSDFKTMEMAHVLLSDNTRLVVNSMGIPEPDGGIPINPSSIQVVFVPLLAYDVHGNRIGYGKGFYDRFLAQCPKDVLKIGLSYFSPELLKLPTNSTDIRINYCISPTKAYIFA